MKTLYRLAAVASAAFFIAGSALAQNVGTVANHAVAVGKGPGVQGLTSVAPGTATFPLVSNGASSDPSFQFLPATGGGTGLTTFAIGDLLQASSTTALASLAAVATGNVLISGGVSTVSNWGKVGLTTHVSGVLPLANGGVGANLSATGGTSQFLRQSTVGGTITVVRPACIDLSTATSYCSATIGQLNGAATNDDALSGNIGELISATATSTSITTGTQTNITSISLSAGDWDVYGTVAYFPAATTNITDVYASINTTSAILDQTVFNYTRLSFAGAGVVPGTNKENVVWVGPRRLSLSATTTVYLVGLANFTVSTMNKTGGIRARRVR